MQFSPSVRVRGSAFFNAAVNAGLHAMSVYNRMYMPTSYGDAEGEYWALRNGVSMWDVGVERQVVLQGPDAGKLAQYLSPRDLTNCRIGQGLYVPLCDHDGHVFNDPVLLKVDEQTYWLSIADSEVLLFAKAVAGERNLDAKVFEGDVCPLAIQGPKADQVMQ